MHDACNPKQDEPARLQAELTQLKTVARAENIEKIKAARALGNLTENAAFDEAKMEQERIEARIHTLESYLNHIESTQKLVSYSDIVKAVTKKQATIYPVDNQPGTVFFDKHTKVVRCALQRLGFYAETVACAAIDTDADDNERDISILLTNASKTEFLTLWDAKYTDEKHYFQKYDPVFGEVFLQHCEGNWHNPVQVYEVGTDNIVCIFDHRRTFSNNLIVIVNQKPKYRSDKVVCFYSKGANPQFSNFYPATIAIHAWLGVNADGTSRFYNATAASVEHYFQMMKALEFDPDGETLKQMSHSLTSAAAKSLGRKVQNFDAEIWHIRRRFHMRDAVAQKFRQNDTLRELLLATGDATLAEANPRDTFWGIGYGENNPKAQDPSVWRGKNVMGLMLMSLRDTLREEVRLSEG